MLGTADGSMVADLMWGTNAPDTCGLKDILCADSFHFMQCWQTD